MPRDRLLALINADDEISGAYRPEGDVDDNEDKEIDENYDDVDEEDNEEKSDNISDISSFEEFNFGGIVLTKQEQRVSHLILTSEDQLTIHINKAIMDIKDLLKFYKITEKEIYNLYTLYKFKIDNILLKNSHLLVLAFLYKKSGIRNFTSFLNNISKFSSFKKFLKTDLVRYIRYINSLS